MRLPLGGLRGETSTSTAMAPHTEIMPIVGPRDWIIGRHRHPPPGAPEIELLMLTPGHQRAA
jgi:hypothetical protein